MLSYQEGRHRSLTNQAQRHNTSLGPRDILGQEHRGHFLFRPDRSVTSQQRPPPRSANGGALVGAISIEHLGFGRPPRHHATQHNSVSWRIQHFRLTASVGMPNVSLSTSVRQMTIEEIITRAGGVTELARITGAHHATVIGWRKARIPVERAILIHHALAIPLHEIRPDVWTAGMSRSVQASSCPST